MESIQKALKYSLAFGLGGAVIIPVVYEIYANISTAVAMVMLLAGVIFAGVKFSFLSFKEAVLGITCTIAYCGIIGMILYLVIHPLVQSMLTESSVYFQLSLKQQAYFLLYTILMLLGMYLIWLVRFGIFKAFEKFRSNNQKTKEYIENAFDDIEDIK